MRDAVLLALPLAPLCRRRLPGPVPRVRVDPVDDGRRAADAAERADPRWAALDELRFD